MIRFVVVFSLIGACLSIVFAATWSVLERHPGSYSSIATAFADVTVLLWPSSLMMLGFAGKDALPLMPLILAVLLNALLYALLGALLWWGTHRHRWVLYALGVAIALAWYRLLTL